MLVDFMLWVALAASVATIILIALMSVDNARYLKWYDEFQAPTGVPADRNKLLEYSIAEVLSGSQVVGTTHIGERRTNR